MYIWVTICQCTFISCNICTTLVGDINFGSGYACVGAEWLELSVPSSQICPEPKTALRKSLFICKFILSIFLSCGYAFYFFLPDQVIITTVIYTAMKIT